MRQLAVIGFVLYLILMLLILSGCTNQYDACIEKEKAEYRNIKI